MGEATKVACVLVFMASAIVAAIAWADDRPNARTWWFRIGAPIPGILAVGLFLKLHFRADTEHDYLRDYIKTYFNRDGFCFEFNATVVEGVAVLELYFQSQYTNPGMASIALRPHSGLFGDILYQVEYPPAAFGLVRMPLPMSLQGIQERFQIGATVRYPKGKGRRVRFHDGVVVRDSTNFQSLMGGLSRLAQFANGSILALLRSDNLATTTTTILLPRSVVNAPGKLLTLTEVVILWQLGDPPPESLL